MRSESPEYKLFETNDIARYGILSVTGKVLGPIAYKSLMYLIWKSNVATPGKFGRVRLSISELCEALGYERDGNRNFSHRMKNVCSTVKGIMSKELSIYDCDEQKTTSFVWLRDVKVHYDQDLLIVDFSPDLSRFFGKELINSFTVVRLMYLNRLDTTAAVILYPFFCRYQKIGSFRYPVRELARLITGDSDYPYKYLKDKHIRQALTAINQLTDIHVEMTENREGRKVSSLSFTVTLDPAEDEKECFLWYNGMKPDEYGIIPYDRQWTKAYQYVMALKRYIPCLEGGI